MRAFVRAGFTAGLGLAAVGLASVSLAQAPPSAKTKAAPAPRGTAPSPEKLASLSQVVATVNGEKITKGDVIKLLSNYQLPPESDEQIYRDAVDTLVNTRLVNQFLMRQKGINVTEARIDEAVDNLKKQLKTDGRDLPSALVESNTSLDDVRKEFANRIRWVDYLKAKGTDPELHRFADTHKDLLNGTQVRASHILLKLEPNASAAEKEKVRKKLLSIKSDIEAGKLSFAEAANKYSEDPANAGAAGGDIGFFGLNTGIVEEFAEAAFALKKGAISDPVETVHGLHLIQVTDRKEGGPIDFEQKRPFITHMYAADLQKRILQQERKTAKIDVKPMPPDLFPPAPKGDASRETDKPAGKTAAPAAKP